jgi:hypothetical protein
MEALTEVGKMVDMGCTCTRLMELYGYGDNGCFLEALICCLGAQSRFAVARELQQLDQ